MNFLIISDDIALTEEVTSLVQKVEKSSKIYNSDFSLDNLKKVKKYFDKTSFCIIYSKEADKLVEEDIARLCSMSGFLIASHISIVTNLAFISNYHIFSKDSIKNISSDADILKYITSKYDHIYSADLKRTAKQTLLNKGIPFTPDCFALYISKNKKEIFDLFIAADMDVNATDDLGTPMLNIAVRNDNEEFAKEIIEQGADINAVSKDRGYTAVMDAVWRGNEELTKLLISKGADLNTINKEGQNNLVLAVGANKEKIVELLATNGADPDVPDMMGMSAYNYATLFKKERIVEILKPYHKA